MEYENLKLMAWNRKPKQKILVRPLIFRKWSQTGKETNKLIIDLKEEKAVTHVLPEIKLNE